MDAINNMFVSRVLKGCFCPPDVFTPVMSQVKLLPQMYSCKATVMEILSPTDGKEKTCHPSDGMEAISWDQTPDSLKTVRWNRAE